VAAVIAPKLEPQRDAGRFLRLALTVAFSEIWLIGRRYRIEALME